MFKIIIAEDLKMNADSLAISIKQAINCQSVVIVGDGRELVVECEKIKPDLIILDIGLPKLDGFKATKEIRKTNKEVKILACSMYKDRDTVIKILQAGANGFFHKSSDFPQFVNAVFDVMNGIKYIDPLVQGIVFNLEKAEVENPNLEMISSTHDGAEKVFTKRELRILRLLAEGMSTKEIGDLLELTDDAVNYHRSNMLEKTQCKNVAHLIRWASVNYII